MNQRQRVKRQAFAASKDPKTKAASVVVTPISADQFRLTVHRVKYNASSRLLRLPAEIRERIWRYLLGDLVIHLKFATSHRWEGFAPEYRVPLTQHVGFNGTWTYIICDATTSEIQAHTLFHSEVYNEYAASQPAELDQRVCRYRHKPCYARYDDCIGRSLHSHYDDQVGGPIDYQAIARNRLPSQALRVCRQMYIEINPVLWGTNIWSFTHSRTLYKFLDSRNAVQRRILKKLHLDLDPRYSWREEHWAYFWFSVLNRSLLKKFPAVHTVHIDITGNRSVRNSDWVGGVRRMRADTEFNMLLDLWILAPEVLTVTCMDTYNVKDDTLMDHSQRVRMAEGIRAKLLSDGKEPARPMHLIFSKTPKDV